MHTRECYNADIEVYKLGRSKTLDNRVKQYPNGSKILFMMNCINSILLESILIKLFKTKYVQQTLYGTEYFLGNQKEMIKDIINCILTQDIPIVLNQVSPTEVYEGILKDDPSRIVVWELTFSAKIALYGPVHTNGLIKTADINIFDNIEGSL